MVEPTSSSEKEQAEHKGMGHTGNGSYASPAADGALKTQWVIGAAVGFVPIAIIIYFMFFWQPVREEADAGADSVVTVDRPEVVSAVPGQLAQGRIPPKLRETERSKGLSKEEIERVIERRLAKMEAQQRKLNENAAPSTKRQTTLDTSDDEVIEALAALSPSLEWYIWLYTDEVVRKFVTVIDNLAEGKIISRYISVPRPSKPASVMEVTDRKFLDTGSYERYNAYADIFDAIDNQSLVDTYWKYFPLLEQAYAELGYPDDRKFHFTMLNALDNLLAAPVIHDEIELQSLTPVLYKFADPQLESLPSAHKQLIRMGPRNTLIITRKLEQLRALLLE